MEREARMKKIAARGTDRMALITGRIQNVDPNYSKASSFSNIEHHLPVPQHARSASQPVGPKNDAAFLQHYLHGGDDDPGTLRSHDSNKEVSKGNVSPKEDEFETSPESALVANSDDSKYPDKPFEYHLSSVSPREIHFSIISSENTRVVCSFVIALLVVLSHVNLPHKVIKSKSLIAYRPLYAVLLTDMLIVGARLALYSQGQEEEREVKLERDLQNWDGAVKLLEWGLMMHQTLRAVFIDCSLYLAIVICGLSLLS